MLLLGVVRIGKLATTKTVDLLEGCAFRFQLFRDAGDHLLDAFFLALHFQDVDSFVLSFHEMFLGGNVDWAVLPFLHRFPPVELIHDS